MKKLTYWAKANSKMAIALIIALEISKLTIGTLIGYDFLPKFENSVIEISVISIILLISFVEIRYEKKILSLPKSRLPRFRILNAGIISISCYFLSISFGNHLKSESYFADNQHFANAVSVEKKVDSVFFKSDFENHLNSKKIDIRSQKKNIFSKKSTEDSPNDGGRRVLYFLLFLLGLVLAFFGLYAFCALACSNYAVAAILVLLIDVGVFSGGIYFLIKTFRKVIKPYKEMDKQERKTEWKRYLRTLLAVTGLIGLLILFNTLTNNI